MKTGVNWGKESLSVSDLHLPNTFRLRKIVTRQPAGGVQSPRKSRCSFRKEGTLEAPSQLTSEYPALA